MTDLGYYSSSLGWINQATNGGAGIFEISDNLNMAGFSIENADNGSFAGEVLSTSTKTGSIEEKDATTNILPFLSQTSETYHAEVTNSGGVILLSAPAVMSGLLRFDTSAVTSFTWPDYNSVNAELSVKNDGTGNKYSAFYTVVVNQTGANIPAAIAATGQTFEDGARNPIKNGMAHKFLSIVGAGSYQTTLVSQCTADLNSDFSVFGDLITEGGALDADGGDLNIGAKAGTNDINIGKAGQNTIIKSDNLKCNSIVPNGAGPIFIDGEALQVFSPGNDIHCNIGWVNGSPPTDEAVLHIEGKGDSGILVDGGDDGTGAPYLELRGETRSIAVAVDVDATTDDVIIEASTQTSKAQNDIIFKVGGQYASDPGLDNRVAPTGGVEALKIYGADQNVEISNKLFFPDNKIQIGDADTESARNNDISIGKNAKSYWDGAGGNTANNIAIGTSSQAGDVGVNVINTFALGSLAKSTASTSLAIGYDANNSGSQGIALGRSANCSNSNAIACGTNTSSSGAGSIAFGNNASAQNNDSISIGTLASANGVGALAIGNGTNSVGTNAVSIYGGANAVSNTAKLFDDSYGIDIGSSLEKGQTNNVWSNTAAPIVDTGTLYMQNAASYTLDAEEIVNGIVRSTYNVGVSTITFPTRTQVVNFLENGISGTPAAGTQTRHSIFETTFINTTAQTVTLTAGTDQTAVGNSLSAGIPAQSCVTFKHYLSNSFYITVRTSTEALS